MLDILYEDEDLIVVVKPAGVESQSGKSFAVDLTSMIKKYLQSQKRDNSTSTVPYLGVVHRLDRGVKGVMIYAKTPFAARELSKQIAKNQIKKHYYALLCGKPALSEDILVDKLYHDKKLNITKVIDDKAYVSDDKNAVVEKYRDNLSSLNDNQKAQIKEAKLTYKIVPRSEFRGFDDYLKQENESDRDNLTLVDIELITGRHHQIRVQFANQKTPLWGDTKYNPEFQNKKGWRNIALCAYKLEFIHPKTKKKMTYAL